MRNYERDYIHDALFVRGFLGFFYKLAVALTPLIIAGVCWLYKNIKQYICEYKEKKTLENAQSTKEVINND